jgi:uncharacterized protein (TIGR02271 family)
MPTIDDIRTWRGEQAHGRDGEKLGTIADIYLDRDSGEPEWAAIKTGLFGTKVSFAPLAEATHSGDGVQLPYTKDQVKDAPNAEADGELSQEEEAALYRHYGLDYSDAPSDSGLPTGHDTTDRDLADGDLTDHETTGRGPVGHDTSGPTTDEAMTRSEEELRVGTTQREAGRARLRKYVVTEQQSVNVPVSREEVRIEREPITDANRGDAYDGPELSGEEHEVVLNEERPVVNKETVPVERVRLGKEQVTENRQVTEDVAHEEIETDGDGIGGTAGRGDRI